MSDLKSDNIRREAQNDVAGLRSKISSLTEDQVDLILSGARSHYAASWHFLFRNQEYSKQS